MSTSKETVSFSPEGHFRADIEDRFADLKAELESLIPGADIQHVGSTAVPGSLTKGDLDIQVRVDASSFSQALKAMRRRFVANPGGFAEANAVSFDDISQVPSVGIHLTAIGSTWDIQWIFRDRLLASDELREEYDQLKRRFDGGSMDAYREEKADFVSRVVFEESDV